MTPKFLLLFGLCLFFAACDKETDFISQVDGPFSTTLSGSDPELSISQRGLLREDTCNELQTTHWLSGNWNFQPVPMTSPEETHGNTLIAKRYIIQASGDAMSPEYARGFSQLNLQYDIYRNGSHKIRGTMVTEFYYGEVMEMAFDCHAKLIHGEQTTNLHGLVQEATLNIKAESFELSDGEITFILSFIPGDKLKIDIETSSVLCIQ